MPSSAMKQPSRGLPNPIKGERKIESTLRFFFRSVGLKILANRKFFKQRNGKEEKKVLFSSSRSITIARVGAHVLPVLVTSCIIALNAVGLLRGPDIASGTRLSLQVASKLHVRYINSTILNRNGQY